MKLQKDLKEFIALLNSLRIEFVVVGAYAVAFHGYPRFTGDIDLFIRPSLENAAQTARALNSFGFPVAENLSADLTQPERIIQLGRAPNRIDLLTSISGVTFDEAWGSSIATELDGVPVRVLGREMLLKNKRESGRTKDLADIEGILRERKRSK